jgi:hypothetical protein
MSRLPRFQAVFPPRAALEQLECRTCRSKRRVRPTEPARCGDLPDVRYASARNASGDNTLPTLDELISEGLVVRETVDVMRYEGRRAHT